MRGGTSAPEAWLLLHGYGQTAEAFLDACGALADPRRRLIVPEALSRFYLRGGRGPVGASWMTRACRADEIDDQRVFLDAVCAAELRAGQRPSVLGFSQGAAAASRWAASGAFPVERLVLWGAGVPADIDPAALAARGTRVSLVRGERDTTAGPEEIEEGRARLAAAGVAVERVELDGGHEIDARLLRAAGLAP